MNFATLTPTQFAPFIQHTKIQANATKDEMVTHIQQAAEYGFNAAMVPGSWVPLAVNILEGTGITVASALDFPTVGVMTSAGKAAEAAELVRLGAREIDIGVQIGWLKSGMYQQFKEDIAGVVRAAGVPIKVMLELPWLTPQEREIAVELSMEAGVAYLKNASSGQVETANPTSISFLAERAKTGVLVKASGSIKYLAQARELLHAGAALLGTSAGIEIITDSSDERTKSY
jgi:deoxyribose-phosphate aldolase